MKFRALQENLRKHLRDRIRAGELTGMRLATQAGFRQAHISNFLNRKRGLSLEGMDKVLSVLHISVLDLLDPAEIRKRATIIPPSDDEFEPVVLVESSVAATEPLLVSDNVREIIKIKKSFLGRLRSAMESDRRAWQRFVLIRVSGRDGLCMYPRVLPGATLLIDRHYNSLAPYRRNERNMYAVVRNGRCCVRYVEHSGGQLILRPENPAYPVEFIKVGAKQSPGQHLVGRICNVSVET